MKCLVTGATGFIGSHIVDVLLDRGFEVRCLVRSNSDLTWLKGKNVELFEASYTDMEKLKLAVKDIDIIYHVAGIIAAKNYDGYLQGNKLPTINLLNAVLESNTKLKRFLYVSSQTASGPSESREKPKTEDMPMTPITSYGKSKKETELEVYEYFNKIPITIVRPPAVYGPRDKAIFAVFQSVKLGIGTLMGFNDKYVSLVHSSDLSRGIVDASLSENTISKIYFISSKEFYTWKQIINIIKKTIDKKLLLTINLPHSIILTLGTISEYFGKLSGSVPVFNYEKGIDFIQDYWTCSIEKAAKDFGYEQKMSIEDGIAETIQWYKQNKWM